MRQFLIKVRRVVLEHKPPVHDDWIRGDLIRNVRAWNKSEKDERIIPGPMTHIIIVDPDLKMHKHIQIAEGVEEFAKRLYDHKNDSANRYPVTKQTS